MSRRPANAASPDQTCRRHAWLHRFACLIAGLTFLLLLAGANVTSNRAGLAVPDWPTTYGEFMFSFPFSKMVGGIFHEHAHRLIASLVGMLTIVLAVWCSTVRLRRRLRWAGLAALAPVTVAAIAYGFRNPFADIAALVLAVVVLATFLPVVEVHRWVRRLAWIALAVVVAQGILGGLTVRFFLPTVVSVAHAGLAEAFFCLTIALAMVSSRTWFAAPQETPRAGWLQCMTAATVAVVYAQIILGAVIRHADRGVFAHIFGAIVVLLCVGITVTLVFVSVRRRDFVLPLATLTALVFAQIWIGVATLVVRVPKSAHGQLDVVQTLLPTIHLGVGALVLASSFALAMKSFRALRAPAADRATPRGARLGAYIELAKPRIVSMVLVTTALGFFLGNGGFLPVGLLLATLLGVGGATAGAAVLNNYLERDVDALMARTRDRVLPAGLVAPEQALGLGAVLVLAGLFVLVSAVNLLTGFLVLLAAFLYVLVYTPMKRVTWLNTTIGAIPGAIPPMCGWAAATGGLEAGAWILFAILFAWQHPHFFAIAWMYRDDYANAGFKMLPVVEPSGARTFQLTLLFSVLLIGASVLPTLVGMTGWVYFWGVCLIGLGLLAAGVMLAITRTVTEARRLLRASVVYLPLLLGLIVVDTRF
jgi:protoheme IX farnesyltransferase